MFDLGADIGREAGLVADGLAGAFGGGAELGAAVLEFEDFVLKRGDLLGALGEFEDGRREGVEVVEGDFFLVRGEVVENGLPGFCENVARVFLAGAEDGDDFFGVAAALAKGLEVSLIGGGVSGSGGSGHGRRGSEFYRKGAKNAKKRGE